MEKVNIVGAGLAGLSAAITLAEKGMPCRLISRQPSERAQSVLAEGGINAALDNMGEGDTPCLHMEDTLRAGCDIADPEAVRKFTETAPSLVERLVSLGVPFNVENGVLMQRPFGGQKKRRTVYAKSSTGKIVMTALIDLARKYEAQGLIERFSHHMFAGLMLQKKTDGRLICRGLAVMDILSGNTINFDGEVILALGGLNGFFPGMTTGTTANSGDAQSVLFMQGVRFGNLEMIQYHPTTMAIPGKRCLVSEAARGEGGRLYILKDGKPWYFMEEKYPYPQLGNLMPRDVVSREMYFVLHDPQCGDQVYLDMTGLDERIWNERLADLREEVIYYQGIDPKKVPLPVDPGIHYFMGGIDVDIHHRTSVERLHAAGECCDQYHGANRLGGNSMIGAVYGGKTAAEDVIGLREMPAVALSTAEPGSGEKNGQMVADAGMAETAQEIYGAGPEASPETVRRTAGILAESMAIARDGETLQKGLDELEELPESLSLKTLPDRGRVELARAMIMSALERRESRGAHYRTDYPERDPAFGAQTTAVYTEGGVRVAFKEKR